ncbi:MAG: holo-ACP synthase [Chloroflexi bacterium]|nr:holo-ACP synthase [Chloroflexota bacterium]
MQRGRRSGILWGAALSEEARLEGLSVRTGVDLVKLEEFRMSLQRGGEAFVHRLFHPSEARGASIERLAGIFAVKEAAYKALGLPRGNWHVLEVRHSDEGRPSITFAPEYDASHVVSCDVSISHSGEYIVACVVALLRG